MSLYSIEDTTLMALADTVRNKTSKYIYKDTPWEQPIYSIDYDSRDYDIVNDWKYSSSNYGYHTSIDIPLKELLGDTLSMYVNLDVIGRNKFLINFTYESNMEKSLIWDFCVTPTTGGIWNDRYVGQSSTFLTRELVNRLVEPSNNSRDFTDKYYISMDVLKTSIEKGFWFKFHFDIKILTANNKYVYLNTFTPLEMVENINNLEIIPESAYQLTGSCNYRFAENGLNWLIEQCGSKITTKNLTSVNYLFNKSNKLKEIPFDINMNSSQAHSASYMFDGCSSLRNIPMINNMRITSSGNSNMFSSCYYVRYFPEGFGENWIYTDLQNATWGSLNNLFYACYSLREAPLALVKNNNNLSTSSYSSPYYYTFTSCYCLDEIKEVAVSPASLTSNAFTTPFNYTTRIKDMTFSMNNDGTPKTAKWKNQIIDLSVQVGYTTSSSKGIITGYNSGITADKEVKDDATYQALKNDPDWFSADINYSRYNHDSAVNTINSLPDCSATGTNTIKFKGASGALTDGGAINTLTEAEIAVASAKGWTVSFV